MNLFRSNGCLEGYTGPLCQSCTSIRGRIYAKKSTKFTCTKCFDKNVEFILMIVIYFIYFTFYVIVLRFFIIYCISNKKHYFRINLKSCLVNPENKDFAQSSLETFYMKILINYFQIIMIISSIQLNWDSSIKDIFFVHQAVSGAFFEIISFDCLNKQCK